MPITIILILKQIIKISSAIIIILFILEIKMRKMLIIVATSNKLAGKENWSDLRINRRDNNMQPPAKKFFNAFLLVQNNFMVSLIDEQLQRSNVLPNRNSKIWMNPFLLEVSIAISMKTDTRVFCLYVVVLEEQF